MKRWHKVVDDLTLKDGSTVKEYGLVFETTDKKLSKRVEKFFQSLMDEAETVPLNTPLRISDYNIEATYSTREDSVFVITKIEPQLKNCADLWNWDEGEPQTDDLQDWKDRMWAEAVIEPTISPSDCATCKHDLWSTPRTCGKCVGQKDGKPSMYKPKDEPQTDCSWGAPNGEI